MSFVRAFGAATALAAASMQSAAAAEPPRQMLASSADLLRFAEAAQRSGDARTAERALRALFSDHSPAVRSEARFRVAKLLTARGRMSDAAVLLRQVVDENPRAAAARLELAGVLHKLGEENLALRELRAIRTTALPAELANFVDRWAASLTASKPFGIQAEFALAPDSNINRATRSDTLGTVFGDFLIDGDSKARSGVGAAVRTAMHGRIPVGEDASLVARAGLDANLFRDPDFNFVAGDLSVGPELRLGHTRLSIAAGVGRTWYGMKPFSSSTRLSAGVAQPIDAVSQLRIDGGLRWSDNRRNDLQDGTGLSVRLAYERALSSEMFVSLSAGRDRFRAADAAYSTRATTFALSASRDFGRTTISAGAEVGWLEADERLALLSERRQDRFSRFQVGAAFRQFSLLGFAPVTRLVVERNRSTVEFYDYARTRTEVGFTRAF